MFSRRTAKSILTFLGLGVLTSATALTVQQKATVDQAKVLITHDFKDPSSAQWRGLYLMSSPDGVMLCGEVNGKNSYGAYVGFRKFFVDPAAPSYSVARPTSAQMMSMFNDQWDLFCSPYHLDGRGRQVSNGERTDVSGER